MPTSVRSRSCGTRFSEVLQFESEEISSSELEDVVKKENEEFFHMSPEEQEIHKEFSEVKKRHSNLRGTLKKNSSVVLPEGKVAVKSSQLD